MSWDVTIFIGVALAFIVYQQIILHRCNGRIVVGESRIEKTSQILIQKNIELSDQNIRLQKLLEAKSDFIGIASHQLRTPVTEIKWGVGSLLEGLYGVLTDDQSHHVKKILNGCNKMIRLINELLELVNSEGGYNKYHFERCDMENLISDVLVEVENSFPLKKHRVTARYEFNKPIFVDPTMIRMAVTNLITNAFYYTREGGIIRIKTERRDDRFYFEVADSGEGIPLKRQELVFQKFKRFDVALRMHSGGIGLGLYIAKNVIDQHRGEIGFTSKEGKGSIFFFFLPLKDAG